MLVPTLSFILAACLYETPTPTPDPSMPVAPVPTLTDFPSAATETVHETFTLTESQAREVSVFMDFIRAYNEGQLDQALAFLSDDIIGSDCDYQNVKVISFRGKSEAAEWLRDRMSEYDRLEVSQIYNHNPDSSGEHVIGVSYSRRSNTTLESLGFPEGITLSLGSKVVFDADTALIKAFANGPFGGDPEMCRPGGE